MSPEQARGGSHRSPQRHLHVRHRAPGDGDRHAAISAAAPVSTPCTRSCTTHRRGCQPPIGEATDDLQKILDRCLAKAAGDRYQAMPDVVSGSSDRSPTARFRRTSGRRRTAAFDRRSAIGAVVTVAVALAVVADSGCTRAARRSRPIARLDIAAGRAPRRHRPLCRRVARRRAPDCSAGLVTRGSNRCCGPTSQTVTLTTDPPGADVAFKAYDDLRRQLDSDGPIAATASVCRSACCDGESRRPGSTRSRRGSKWARRRRRPVVPTSRRSRLRLRPVSSAFAGMVFVPGGHPGRAADRLLDRPVPRSRIATSRSFIDRRWLRRPVSRSHGPSGAGNVGVRRLPGRGRMDIPCRGVSWFEAVALLPVRRQDAADALPLAPSVWRGVFRRSGHGWQFPRPRHRSRRSGLKDIGPFGTYGDGRQRQGMGVERGRRPALHPGRRLERSGLHGGGRRRAAAAEDRSDTNGFRCIKETTPSAAAVYAAAVRIAASRLHEGKAGRRRDLRTSSGDSIRTIRTPLDARIESVRGVRSSAARACLVRRRLWRRARPGQYPDPEERVAAVSGRHLVSGFIRAGAQTQRRRFAVFVLLRFPAAQRTRAGVPRGTRAPTSWHGARKV